MEFEKQLGQYITDILTDNEKKVIEQYSIDINTIIGKQVTVWNNKTDARNNFEDGMSIQGILEGANNQFRIVISDGTYVYFTSKTIVHCIQHPTQFKDGSKINIQIRW